MSTPQERALNCNPNTDQFSVKDPVPVSPEERERWEFLLHQRLLVQFGMGDVILTAPDQNTNEGTT